MSKVYVFLADGFETVEALAPVDVMRRAGLDVVTVSIMESKNVLSAQNVPVVADIMFGDAWCDDADALVLPGGGVGTDNLSAHEELRALLAKANSKGTLIAAICAAPMVLGRVGILQGHKATCYPGYESALLGAIALPESVVASENCITAKGAGVTIEFALRIVARLISPEKAREIGEAMQCR